jgi:hypothetical protein
MPLVDQGIQVKFFLYLLSKGIRLEYKKYGENGKQFFHGGIKKGLSENSPSKLVI